MTILRSKMDEAYKCGVNCFKRNGNSNPAKDNNLKRLLNNIKDASHKELIIERWEQGYAEEKYNS